MALAINSARLQPSLLPAVAAGLDLTRTIPGRALGTHLAASAAVILAGHVVARNSSGEIVLCTGANAMGISKWNKAASLYGTVVKEPVVLTGTDTVNLKHATVSNVLVEDSAGTAYTITTDYTKSDANGTITRVALGGIADGETVYVTYTYLMLNSDLEFQGRNFFNGLDDTAQQLGRLTVIEGLSQIFCATYDTSKQWAVNDVVTCGTTGFLTKGGSGDKMGKVIQVPTAEDPYLGFTMDIVAA